MVGHPKSMLALVQRLGFFWEYPDSQPLKDILQSQNQEKLRQAAYHQVMALTNLLDGNYSAYGMRMIGALGLDSLEKLWKYRVYLMKTFDLELPQDMPVQAWLQSESCNEYGLAKLAKEFSRVFPNDEFVAGIVIGEFTPDYSLK